MYAAGDPLYPGYLLSTVPRMLRRVPSVLSSWWLAGAAALFFPGRVRCRGSVCEVRRVDRARRRRLPEILALQHRRGAARWGLFVCVAFRPAQVSASVRMQVLRVESVVSSGWLDKAHLPPAETQTRPPCAGRLAA